MENDYLVQAIEKKRLSCLLSLLSWDERNMNWKIRKHSMYVLISHNILKQSQNSVEASLHLPSQWRHNRQPALGGKFWLWYFKWTNLLHHLFELSLRHQQDWGAQQGAHWVQGGAPVVQRINKYFFPLKFSFSRANESDDWRGALLFQYCLAMRSLIITHVVNDNIMGQKV